MEKISNNKIDMNAAFDLKEFPPKKEEPTVQTEQENLEAYFNWAQRKLLFNRASVKTPINQEFFPKKNTRFSKPSLTVPDQTLPIKEILARYAKGIPVGVKTPIYEGEDSDFPDPRTLDLVDLQELREQHKEEMQRLGDAVRKQKEESIRKKIEAEEKAKNTLKNDPAPGGGKEGGGNQPK